MLGVSPQATGEEIKAAYRALVKQHHPDAGGDATTILALNAAWEVLGDGERRTAYDRQHTTKGTADSVGQPAAANAASAPRSGAAVQEAMEAWLQAVYAPIDRLLGQVINPFAAQLRALSADPYDDHLMEAFCTYLEQSQQKMLKVETLYRASAAPVGLEQFSLQLYHCLAQVKDALVDLERYTMGYVDSYLRDGRELLREAKRLRSALQHDRRTLL